MSESPGCGFGLTDTKTIPNLVRFDQTAWLSQKGRGNFEPAGAQPAPKGDGEAPSSTPAMALLMEQMEIVYLVLVHHPPTARKGGENHRCLQAVCSLKINN